LSSEEHQRKTVMEYWWEKADSCIFSAKREFDAGEYSFVINRLYYALYYAVSAVLLVRNLSFRKHSGVRSAFHREIVKTGLIDPKWGLLYDQLFEDRHEGDYVALVEFDRMYAETKLKQCIEFLEVLRRL